MTTLTEEDAQAMQRDCPAVAFVSPGTRAMNQVIAGNLNWATVIDGEGAEYLEIRTWTVEYGDFFTDQDVKSAAKVCVLGKTVADNLFPDGDPVGQTVRIRNVPVRVLGVLSKKGQNAMGQDQDDIIIAPYTTVLRRLSRFPFLRQIVVSATSPAAIDPAQKQITDLLRMRHKISAYDPDDFTLRNQTDIAQAATATTQILTILLASIASVSLLVGGIGIMNIMLVSVTERTREIGLRQAVGAKTGDILLQFLVEAVTLSLLGGIVGIAVGLAASLLISHFAKWSTAVSPLSILLAFLFSALVGVFFGYYPARKAAFMDPIEALRYE